MNDHFVYGFLFAVVVLSGILALQYGNNFNFLNDDGLTVIPSFGTALNWKSAICLCVLFGIFFRNLPGKLYQRIMYALLILCLGWAVMDLFWILKAHFCGNFLFGSDVLSVIDLTGLLIGVVRNSMMIAIASLFVSSFLRISKLIFFAFAGVVTYWIFLICSFPYSGYFFNTFIVYGVNFLPLIISVKTWSGKSWRKFLFA